MKTKWRKYFNETYQRRTVNRSQDGGFKLLKEGQTIPIHGSVPKGAKLPYITLGAATFKPLSNKDLIIWDASLNVEVWAGEDGKNKSMKR